MRLMLLTAFRNVRNHPLSSICIVMILWIGFSVFSSQFAIYDSVLVQPLPLPQSERLVQVKRVNLIEGRQYELEYFVYRDFLQLKNGTNASTFDKLVAIQDGAKNNIMYLQGLEEPERLNAARVTDDFFDCLGLQPALGRSVASVSEHNEVLLTHGTWSRRFGADPNVLGKKILLNEVPHTIVGVMPALLKGDAEHSLLRKPVDLWLPLTERQTSYSDRSFRILGRLQPATSLRQASFEMTGLMGSSSGGSTLSASIQVVRLRDELTKHTRHAFRLLNVTGAFVFLLACSNALGLLLVRNVHREREVAVRQALGIQRSQLVFEWMIEGLIFAGLAGLVTLLTSGWSIRVMVSFFPTMFPRMGEASLSQRSAIFVAGVSLIAGLILGLVTALQILDIKVQQTLSRNGSGAISPELSRRLHQVVMLEVTVSVVLLIGAGLMFKSYTRILDNDPGIQTHRILVVDVFLPLYKYWTNEGRNAAQFFERAKEELASIPGVESVAITSSLPLRSRDYLYNQWRLRRIDSAYFDLLEIPLVKGRNIKPPGDLTAGKTIVVNQALASQFFPRQDPIGEVWNDEYEIVGIVSDVCHQALDLPAQPAAYVHHLQEPDNRMSILIQSETPPKELVASIKERIWSLDPDQPISQVESLEQLARNSQSVHRRQFLLVVIGSLSVVAMALAATGIYGVIALTVSKKRKEFSIRMALGGRVEHLLKLLLLSICGLIGRGVGAGFLLAILLSSIFAEALFQTSPVDPVVFLSVATLLFVIGGLASLIPLRRTFLVSVPGDLRHE